jgi:DNA-binding transcriptional LysR family regulator
LLERSTQQLRMTGISQDYYERCRRGFEEFEAANLLINDRQSEVLGTLRIFVPPIAENIPHLWLIQAPENRRCQELFS